MNPIDKNPEFWWHIIANVVPILNGKDPSGNIIHLSPYWTRNHRYLLIAFAAKTCPVFRSIGKEMDNLVYYTLHSLGKIADSIKQLGPYHQPIHYDRTKVAGRVYTILCKKGLVIMKIIDFNTYITITDEGENVSKELLVGLDRIKQFKNEVGTTSGTIRPPFMN
jgi:hypothetical protein